MWRCALEDSYGSVEGPSDSEAYAILEGHKHDVYGVICRDGGATILSAGYDRMVREWDVSTARQVHARLIALPLYFHQLVSG
jgi:WD40 repeat protein